MNSGGAYLRPPTARQLVALMALQGEHNEAMKQHIARPVLEGDSPTDALTWCGEHEVRIPPGEPVEPCLDCEQQYAAATAGTRPKVASPAAPTAVAALIQSADDPKVTGIRQRRRP